MMLKTKYYIAFLLLVNPGFFLFSQNISSGALFLNLPHNVSQYSIGDSASLLGLDGVHTNPASTTLPDNTSQYYVESSTNFSQILIDVFFSNISFLYWFGDLYGTLSVTTSLLYYGGIDITDTQGNLQGQATAYDFYVSLNYSRKIFFDILIGVNVKVIQQKLHTFNAFGFAADFGIKKKVTIGQNELWLSLSGNNFGDGITFDQEENPLPSKIGGATSFLLHKWLPDWFSIEMGPQFNYFLEGHYDLTWGSNFLFYFYNFEIYALAKYKYNSANQNQLSFGGGISYSFSAYQIYISFGINPFLENIEFITSGKFVYKFGIKKLKQVKPVDFSEELNYDDSNDLPIDSDEIVIPLEGPTPTLEENTKTKKE